MTTFAEIFHMCLYHWLTHFITISYPGDRGSLTGRVSFLCQSQMTSHIASPIPTAFNCKPVVKTAHHLTHGLSNPMGPGFKTLSVPLFYYEITQTLPSNTDSPSNTPPSIPLPPPIRDNIFESSVSTKYVHFFNTYWWHYPGNV